MLNQYGKDFVNILKKIKPSKHVYEVFSDWLVRDEDVEEEYMNVAKQYTKEEIEKHGHLLAIVVEALEEKEQDFLGEVFSYPELNLSNSRTGQFFTPYHISLMMAKAIIGGNEPPAGRVCKINDPACGAGGMLIAGAMVLKEREFDFQNNALFIGQDIDARCARMAFIQLSLLGVPAVIYCMNTLTMKEYWHRETIGYYMAEMDWRLRVEKMLDIIKNPKPQEAEIREEKTETKVITLPPAREYVQLELFATEEAV